MVLRYKSLYNVKLYIFKDLLELFNTKKQKSIYQLLHTSLNMQLKLLPIRVQSAASEYG